MTPVEERLSQSFIDYWTAFAITGNPNAGALTSAGRCAPSPAYEARLSRMHNTCGLQLRSHDPMCVNHCCACASPRFRRQGPGKRCTGHNTPPVAGRTSCCRTRSPPRTLSSCARSGTPSDTSTSPVLALAVHVVAPLPSKLELRACMAAVQYSTVSLITAAALAPAPWPPCASIAMPAGRYTRTVTLAIARSFAPKLTRPMAASASAVYRYGTGTIVISFEFEIMITFGTARVVRAQVRDRVDPSTSTSGYRAQRVN